MVRHLSLSRTTHTLEMTQIDELNARLTQRRSNGDVITAADLGLADLAVLSGQAAGGKVSPSAVLTAIGWDGDPEFPYLHACFSSSPDAGPGPTELDRSPRVDLHTKALRKLCRRLGLHQAWGTGSAPS